MNSATGKSQAAAGAAELEILVERAKLGDREALESVIEQIRHRVYNLALRMLWHPSDAEDATQEILLRVITHLGTFRAESAFSTWVYRIAVNCLLTTRKRRAEREELTFEAFADQLDLGLAPDPGPETEVERRILAEEVKLGCTLGMLLCLGRDERIAYILGEVFGLSSDEAGDISGVTPATFRKRLSRARARLHGFMAQKCGIVDSRNACRCARRVPYAIEIGRIDPQSLLFADHPVRVDAGPMTRSANREMEQLHSAADLLRGHPSYAEPGQATMLVRHLLETSSLTLLKE